jgi:hypothetical protein
VRNFGAVIADIIGMVPTGDPCWKSLRASLDRVRMASGFSAPESDVPWRKLETALDFHLGAMMADENLEHLPDWVWAVVECVQGKKMAR